MNALSVINWLRQSPLLWGMAGRECIYVASRDGFGAVFLSILLDAPGQSLPVMLPVFFCESDIERFYIFPEVEVPGFSTTSWLFAATLRALT